MSSPGPLVRTGLEVGEHQKELVDVTHGQPIRTHLENRTLRVLGVDEINLFALHRTPLAAANHNSVERIALPVVRVGWNDIEVPP